MMEGHDLEDLISKTGLKLEPEKSAFFAMYDNIFNPFRVPLENDLPIADFRAVYRHQFCHGEIYLSPQKLDELEQAAKAEFTNALVEYESRVSRETSPGTPQNVGGAIVAFEQQKQMKTEVEFIKKVNDWRKARFLNARRGDAASKFGRELRKKFALDYNKFYKKEDIQRHGEKLLPQILKTFSKQIPNFENKAQVEQWCRELRRECAQVEASVLNKNKRNFDSWTKECQPALTKLKGVMIQFFYQYKFATQEQVDSFRAEARTKCEEDHGLTQFLTDPGMKSSWETSVNREYLLLVTKWKAERDTILLDVTQRFRQSVKAQARTMLQQELNLTVDENELETTLGHNLVEGMKQLLNKGGKLKQGVSSSQDGTGITEVSQSETNPGICPESNKRSMGPNQNGSPFKKPKV